MTVPKTDEVFTNYDGSYSYLDSHVFSFTLLVDKQIHTVPIQFDIQVSTKVRIFIIEKYYNFYVDVK